MVVEERIPVSNEEAVAAAYHPGASARWFVCCHGFVSDKTGSYERRCDRAVREDYHAVRFDFRGCGESDGAFEDQTLSSRIEDLAAVLAHYAPDWVVVFGSSFGGKVALHTAVREERIRALVLRSPVTTNAAFSDSRAVVRRRGWYEYAPGFRVDQRFFTDLDTHPFSRISEELDVPVAFYHGRQDASVPVQHTFDAANTLTTDTLVHAFATEGHLFSDDAESRMLASALTWLHSHSHFPDPH